jgi:hypothetical protein
VVPSILLYANADRLSRIADALPLSHRFLSPRKLGNVLSNPISQQSEAQGPHPREGNGTFNISGLDGSSVADTDDLLVRCDLFLGPFAQNTPDFLFDRAFRLNSSLTGQE